MSVDRIVDYVCVRFCFARPFESLFGLFLVFDGWYVCLLVCMVVCWFLCGFVVVLDCSLVLCVHVARSSLFGFISSVCLFVWLLFCFVWCLFVCLCVCFVAVCVFLLMECYVLFVCLFV